MNLIFLNAPLKINLMTLVEMASGSKVWKKKMVGFFIASTEAMKTHLPKQEGKMEAKRHGWLGSTHLVKREMNIEDALGRDQTSVSMLDVSFKSTACDDERKSKKKMFWVETRSMCLEHC